MKDAARLYLLAVEQAPAGAVLNAVGDEGVPVREIAEADAGAAVVAFRLASADAWSSLL